MKSIFCLTLTLTLSFPVLLSQDPCQSAAEEFKLPVKLKTRGKPSRARWAQIDQVLTSLRTNLEGVHCSFQFDDLFRTERTQLYFPLTNNVLRTTPQGTFQGVQIFGQTGELLGQFSNRVTYQRSGGLYGDNRYTLHYFQFEDRVGTLQSSGNRLLLDNFLVKWQEIKHRLAIPTSTRNQNAQ